jgi:hypothetical protein
MIALRSHLLVLLATCSGIVGMGIVFNAVQYGSLTLLAQGMPLFMVGLWWAGHELGRSIDASKARKYR